MQILPSPRLMQKWLSSVKRTTFHWCQFKFRCSWVYISLACWCLWVRMQLCVGHHLWKPFGINHTLSEYLVVLPHCDDSWSSVPWMVCSDSSDDEPLLEAIIMDLLTLKWFSILYESSAQNSCSLNSAQSCHGCCGNFCCDRNCLMAYFLLLLHCGLCSYFPFYPLELAGSVHN